MEIRLNIKLSHQKDSNYTVNLDIDPERIEPGEVIKPKTPLGAVSRPSADRLKIIRNQKLKEEEEATEKVMDGLEL